MSAAAVAVVHARTRGRCVVCLYDGAPMLRAGRAVHRHHVFPVQDVYWPELELEPDGQVGVCFGCHMAHENGSRRIPLGALPRCAFELAARTSQRAVDYLLSTYPDTGPCAEF